MHHCRLSECQAITESFRFSGSYFGAASLEIPVLTISSAINLQVERSVKIVRIGPVADLGTHEEWAAPLSSTIQPTVPSGHSTRRCDAARLVRPDVRRKFNPRSQFEQRRHKHQIDMSHFLKILVVTRS